MGRGDVDDHRIDVRERAEREGFVRDAILAAEDCLMADAGREQVGERAVCVLPFHGEDDNIVTAPVDVSRVVDRGNRQGHGPVGILM